MRIVVLTGAGISAESGIQTFRASDGLWEEHRVEDVATPEGFAGNPVLVQRFYNARRRQLLECAFLAYGAHLALAALERAEGVKLLLVTQNIDDLHERAGSRKLIHMHGELLKMRCSISGQIYPLTGDLNHSEVCPCCGLTETLRPHVVWFGEMPLQMDEIMAALACCDLFVAIGTSGNVYPAAGFVREARSHGAHSVELNLEPSNVNWDFAEHHYGPASTVVPDYIQQLLAVRPKRYQGA